MNDDNKIWVYIIALSMTFLLSACCSSDNKTDRKSADIAMLLDRDATPAPHALVRIQERQLFPMDENKKQYAMSDDRKDRKSTKNTPITIQESRIMETKKSK